MKKVVGSVFFLLVLFFGCEAGDSTEKKASFEERFAVSRERADRLLEEGIVSAPDGRKAIVDKTYQGFRKINDNNFYFFLENGVVVSFQIETVNTDEAFLLRKEDIFYEYSVKIKYNGQEIVELKKDSSVKEISYDDEDNPSRVLKQFGENIATIMNEKLFDERNTLIDFEMQIEIIEN